MNRFFAVASSFALVQGFACTDFMVRDAKKGCVVGRSMEFGLDLASNIIVAVPTSDDFQCTIAVPPNNIDQNAFSWSQKYAYIGITAFDDDQIIVDGVNDQGLSVGLLWLPDADYPQTNFQNLKKMIPLQDVSSWLLGVASNVTDVKHLLANVIIYPEELPGLGGVPPIHFSFHDRAGNNLVVEFIDKKMKITENPISVLTNNPEFSWHMNNLRNYLNLSATNASQKTFNGIAIPPMGQGSGMVGLPGDWTPPSRFVKIALLLQSITQAPDVTSNINLAFHLLNSVDVPVGAIQQANTPPEYTQWAVAKDLQSVTLYFRTYDNLNIQSINLAKMIPVVQATPGGIKKFSMNDLSVITTASKTSPAPNLVNDSPDDEEEDL